MKIEVNPDHYGDSYTIMDRLYKFAAPINAEEAALRFRVLEDRAPRVLVAETTQFTDWAIAPQFVYDWADLAPAGEGN